MPRKDGRESKERKGKEDEKEVEKGEEFEEGSKNDRERERNVFWNVESKGDVEGGQQKEKTGC